MTDKQHSLHFNSSLSNQCDDLAKLSLLNEDILLQHLQQRYEQDLIYVC